MFRTRSIRLAACASALVAGTWTCAAQETTAELETQIHDLRIRNQELERSLVQANRAEKAASEQLAAVRLRLAALGRNLLDGGDDRLVEANANLQVIGERLTSLREVASRLALSVSDYLKQAVSSDPEARLRVETAIRELDETLGLRQKPAPAATGTAGQAKIVSIDGDSGLLVLNIGENQNARIGTAYRLVRGEQPIGSAIIADVRRNVCGAFVEDLDPGAGPVRPGDSVILITQPGR